MVGAEAPPEDTLLVRGVLRGEAEARDRFAARMSCIPRILAALNARLGRPLDEHELEDLAQEVLIVAWRKLPSFDGKSSLESWVYRIAFLTFMNAARRRRRRSVVRLGLEESGAPGRTRRESPWDVERLQIALEELSEQEREILVLKHFDELTFLAIGERLGISDNSAKTRYYRARLRLEERLRRTSGRSEEGGDA